MSTLAAVAADLMAAQGAARLTSLPSAATAGFGLDQAYQVAAETERLRVAQGWQPRGWKIGFTNRSIWPRYNVHQPIWARVWDRTLTLLDPATAEVSLAGLVQPRIEPEIVFGLRRDLPAGAALDEVVDALDWVAHGVEIVHTHFDGWRFGGAADPVADFGLHGRLVVGPRVRVAQWPRLAADLSALTMSLHHGDAQVDQGRGALVLDGPVQALAQAATAMAAQGYGRIAGGEVVTTGTLTDAWPVAAGQTWRTEPGDARLLGLSLRFTA